MISIMKDKKQVLEKGAAILVALLAWHIAAVMLGEELLLVSPIKVLKRLGELSIEPTFWSSVWFSGSRILGGCMLAAVAGILLAVVAGMLRLADILLWPFLAAIKATPVASFIIICLIWFPSESLGMLMSFLMVLPLIYSNILEGIRQTDGKLLEMARVFRMKKAKCVRYIYLPSVMPYLMSSLKVAVGLAFKAGIAAEVIGIPKGSIGAMLYQAKIYLNSADLFAWTVAVVAISILMEKCVVALLNAGIRRMERG